MNNDVIRIALFGTFDYKNYGDLLFPDVFKTQISKLLPTAEIVLFSPVGGIKPFTDNEFIHPIEDLDKVHQIAPISAIVIGGGDVLRLDNAFVSNSKKYLNNGYTSELWIVPILFANTHKIPVYFNAPGVPFYFYPSLKNFLTNILDSVQYVNVRDETSKDIIKKLIPEADIPIVPDTISLLNESFDAQDIENVFNNISSTLKLPTNYALFQINCHCPNYEPKDYLPHLRRIQEIVGASIVLMPIGYVHNDTEVLQSIEDISDGEFKMIHTELTPKEMFSVIGHAKCFIGTSMHGCLTALMQFVPAVALNFSALTKIQGCLSMYHMEDNIVNKIEEITPEMLFRKTDPIILRKLQTRIKEHFNYIVKLITTQPSNTKDSSLNLFFNLASLMQVPDQNFIGHVYFDFGDGFSQSKMENIPIQVYGDEFTIDTTISLPASCKKLRIDPIEGYPICITSDSILDITNKPLKKIHHNGVYHQGATIFQTGDPWIIYDVTNIVSIHIKISGRIATNNDLTLASNVNEQRQHEFRQQLQISQAQLQNTQKYIDAMQNSLSWKITSPIRKILAFVMNKER